MTYKQPFRFFDPFRYMFAMMRVHWQKFFLIEMLFFVPLSIVLIFSGFTGGQSGELLMNPATAGTVFPLIMALGAPLFFFILLLWFPAAYTQLSLLIYDNKPVNTQNVASSIYKTPSFFGAALLVLCFNFLLISLGACIISLIPGIRIDMASMEAGSLCIIVLLGLLLATIGIWFYTRVSLYQFFIVDKGYGALQALQESYKVTRSCVWLVGGVHVSTTALAGFAGALLGVFLTVLPVFWAQVASCAFYSVYGFLLRAPLWLTNVYIYRKLTDGVDTHQGENAGMQERVANYHELENRE